MTLERISDIQIRCILTQQDLSDRGILLQELAYGKENTKELFQEVLLRAGAELNFQVSETPVMIEATPMKNSTLMLDITKITEADELDTRFAKFSPSIEAEAESTAQTEQDYDDFDDDDIAELDDILNVFQNVETASRDNSSGQKVPSSDSNSSDTIASTRAFCFRSLDEVNDLARLIPPEYTGRNILYKDSRKNQYFLLMIYENTTVEDFQRICAFITEYAEPVRKRLTKSYFAEHYDVIIKEDALQRLRAL